MIEKEFPDQIAALTERRTDLSKRLALAQQDKREALAAIVDGKGSGAKAANAEQRVNALSAALSACNVELSSNQVRLAQLHEHERREKYFDEVAIVARAANEKAAELEAGFVAICESLDTSITRSNALIGELVMLRRQAFPLIQQHVPALTSARFYDSTRPAVAAQADEVLRQMGQLRDALAKRGTSYDALMTNWNPGSGGQQSELDTHVQFPTAKFSADVRALLEQTRAEARRAGAPVFLIA
jgi:chromosome segregation ATPase